MNIKIGILGYGNIGRGVETALRDNPDMELAAVFTRRDPSQVKILSENVPVISVSEIEAWKDRLTYFSSAGEALPICRSRHRSMRKCSTW